MWHVSTASQRLFLSERALLNVALAELAGVGDADLGEWIELGGRAVHVRRRLSAEEEALVGPVIDIRGTAEAAERLWKVAKLLPIRYREVVLTADD